MNEKTGIQFDAYFGSPYGLADDMVQLNRHVSLITISTPQSGGSRATRGVTQHFPISEPASSRRDSERVFPFSTTCRYVLFLQKMISFNLHVLGKEADSHILSCTVHSKFATLY
jgi:hypothetical protein